MAPTRFKAALSWRVTEAQPHGMMMWFDPFTEEPGVRLHLHTDSEDGSPVLGSSEEDGTSRGVEGVPLEGSEARTSDRRPINGSPGDPGELPF